MTTATMQLQASDILDPIVQWEHWSTIAQVAHKEYGVSEEQFKEALPDPRVAQRDDNSKQAI